MGMQQENIEKVQSAYDEEKEQLDSLRKGTGMERTRIGNQCPFPFPLPIPIKRERFALLKVDYDAIMEERRLKREEEERKRKEFEEKTYNATVITIN